MSDWVSGCEMVCDGVYVVCVVCVVCVKEGGGGRKGWRGWGRFLISARGPHQACETVTKAPRATQK